ncbi:nucleoside monophosphate kinase [Candidatus Saccharibacteria bacterium]|nr:nucleoside monophosphate kinase [Candidatus Saccharibacteria bacterium]
MSSSFERKIGEIGEWLGTGSLNFFGRQFAGKDIQAARLGSHFQAPVIGGGDILRNSNIDLEVQQQIDKGGLSPTEQYRKIVLPYLSDPSLANVPLMLSAVGRMSGEEQDVIDVTNSAGHPIMAVPYLQITEAESFIRMANSPSRGRVDDTPQGLRKRLDQFNEFTAPVLKAYEDMDLLVSVDAMPEEDIVFNSLVNMLHERIR